jgi:tetratricopeptide (TPR) repeat protein
MTVDEHIELSALAQLADGTLPEGEARVAREHLGECRSCFAAYVDAVRYRAAWLADSQAFHLEGEDRSLVEPDRREGRSKERGRGGGGKIPRFAPLASIAALLAVLILVRAHTAAPTLGFRLPPATLEASARSAADGLVVPGADLHADGPRLEQRSGATQRSLELEAELKAATDAYEAGSRSPTASARLIAAFLADGDIAAANDFSREALRVHPNDVPLLVFAAVASSRANHMDEAEKLLRSAIRRAPNDPIVALDLGMVLCRQGRVDEARKWLKRAAASKVAPLAARAQRELGICGSASGRE